MSRNDYVYPPPVSPFGKCGSVVFHSKVEDKIEKFTKKSEKTHNHIFIRLGTQ